MYNTNDTIIALASGMGKGSIAIIRLSGSKSIPIVNLNFKGKDLISAAGNTTHFGLIQSNGNEIDQVIVSVFRSPHSYTGEDCVEISCHANALIIDEIMVTMINHGVRLAKPGEFTFRAFMNGKMNLSQAEAVADIIGTKSKYGIRNSLRQLNGDLNFKIEELKNEIVEIRSLLETMLDFSAEEEIKDIKNDDILNRINRVELEINHLAESYNHAKILGGSITIAIIGKTNVGKSTLMNVLLGEERVITSHTPGTTRDIIHEDLMIDGFHFKLIDTAGLRDTLDHVEIKGMEKTRTQISISDIILWVIDGSEPWQTSIFEQIMKILGKKTERLLLVINKNDLQHDQSVQKATRLCGLKSVKVSSLNKTGIKKLKQVIIKMVSEETRKFSDDLIITNLRQKRVLDGVLKHLRKAHYIVQTSQGYEYASVDFQGALNMLGEITGETTTDEILNRIFSSFCIGK